MIDQTPHQSRFPLIVAWITYEIFSILKVKKNISVNIKKYKYVFKNVNTLA